MTFKHSLRTRSLDSYVPEELKRSTGEMILPTEISVTKLSKLQIAATQLNTAIQLYLQANDLVSALTLAGAAEEILGKLAVGAGAKSALDEKLDLLCGMYEAAFNEKPNRKNFATLRNRARNEFKHMTVPADIEVDLEREAVNMLRRAISNYRKLDSSFQELFRQFEQESLRRDGARTNK